MMWSIERGPHWVGPCRWEWCCAGSSFGLIYGYAWTRRQAERRLRRAEGDLYLGSPS